jgi:2-polyprenyl-3-methyl-5-hydroxy-6-metoxy-1,4-benzoquinol methylase
MLESAEMNEAAPHEIEWTEQRVRRFWDYHGSNPHLTGQYFGGLMGRSLLDYVSKRIRIGTAVDVGCGRGHLIDLLMRRGSDVYGADQSPASVGLVEDQFRGEEHFKGATVGTEALPDGIADTVFMVEVVEHLSEDRLNEALDEAIRLLKHGGHLVLTTPNNENLDASKIMCPNCLTVFHRMQHVRAWSAEGLARRVASHGFHCKRSEGVALTPYSGVLDAAYRRLYLWRHKGARPSLIYIGIKT